MVINLGGRKSDMVLLDENGIRCDGRKVNETRKVTIKAGAVSYTHLTLPTKA